MIDDLVDVHRCECVADGGHYEQWNEYGKVVSITECYITIKYIGREDDYGFEDVDEKDINPIPLTAEMLEKNFPTTEDGVIWSETADGDLFNIRVEYDKYVEGIFKFVHELQHALRLCNIEKTIEL